MYSLSGLVNGNTIKTTESLRIFEGCKVIITILDDTIETISQSPESLLDSQRKAAARELAGLWDSHHSMETVDEVVRSMRRGRQFDT